MGREQSQQLAACHREKIFKSWIDEAAASVTQHDGEARTLMLAGLQQLITVCTTALGFKHGRRGSKA